MAASASRLQRRLRGATMSARRRSSVAHRAVGQMVGRDADRPPAARGPRSTWSAGGRPVGVEHLGPAAAGSAPGRGGSRGTSPSSAAPPAASAASCPTGAVAGRAADALGDMDAVIEIDVVGQLVAPAASGSACPSARLSRTGASIAALVQICEWQVMQVCGRRHAGEARLSRRRCGNSGSRSRGRRHDARG